MKTTNRFFVAMTIMFLLLSTTSFSQDEPKQPEFISVTTMHWNMDNDDFDMDTWIADEKEYMDKVTRKNENVINAGYYLHRFTADNTELIYVRTYPSWEAMGKAGKRDTELAEAAWPDKAKREAYFKKIDNYYSSMHSDEIYAPMDGTKALTEKPTKDLILYLRKSHFAFPADGTDAEFDALKKEQVENVFHKNEFIKGYYPHAHAWGSDKTEFIEAFYLDSMDDLDDMLDKNGELFKAHWSDEAGRKAFGEKMGKYFTGVHGDYIYTYVSGI